MEVKEIVNKIKEWSSHSSNNLYLTLILLAILILLNIFGYFNFIRLDLTQNHQYTLTKASKRIVKNLEDVIAIKVYFSKKLPPYMANLAQQVNDILKEYKAYGKGNITVEYIDPSKNPMTAREVQRMGIPQVMMNIIEKDKQESLAGYLGIAVMFGDKYEVIPVVKDVGLLEYKITSYIKKLTGGKRLFIGLLQNNTMHPNFMDYQTLIKDMAEDYTLRPITVPEDKDFIAEPIDVLVVAGLTNVPQNVLKAIDHFIMTGGRALIMADTVGITKSLQTRAVKANITNLLLSYGVRVHRNLVLDRLSNLVGFNAGMFTYTVQYPFSIKTVNKNYDQTNPVVKDLESIAFQWVNSIDGIPNDNITIATLIKTSKYSWTQTGTFDLNPNMIDIPKDPTQLKQHVLALAVEGKIKSPYTGEVATNARLIITGDSDFISDEILKLYRPNALFFQNAVDWLGLDNDLIQIRSRTITDRPLKNVSDTVKSLFKILNLAGAALFIIIFGLVRGYLRKKERSLYFKILKNKR